MIDATQERFAVECRKPLPAHSADYRAALIAKRNTSKHCEMTEARVLYVITQCGASLVKHLTASSVQEVIKSIRDNGRSLETCNSYLRAIKGFSRWLWRDKRMPDDALATLEAYNAATEDPRHERRELTADEIAWLLPFVQGYTLPAHNLAGPDRAMVYRLALGTGFRAIELRSLTPESFALDLDPPTVTVQAGSSKRRRTDVQPIRGDLADILRPWLASKGGGARLFDRLPGGTARMLRQDFAATRKAWLDAAGSDQERRSRESSDFLTYKDSAGRIADFHATRHTYISSIVASGASVKTAQELARHSSPTLTIGRYSHTRLHDLVGALEGLPDQTTSETQQTLRATGTDDATVQSGQEQRSARRSARKRAWTVRRDAIARPGRVVIHPRQKNRPNPYELRV